MNMTKAGRRPGFNLRTRYKTGPAADASAEDMLRDLVAFPTITDNLAANHKALGYVAKYLRQRGMHVRRFAPTDDYREVLVASSRKDNAKTPTVLLAAHMDVVTAPSEAFQLRKAGNKYFGRGTYDMKFAIVAYMQAVDRLRDRLADYDFAIMITCDEEVGGKHGNGVRAFVEAGYLPKMAILPDGARDWQLEGSAKGVDLYVLEASGKSAHGSRPWEGDNALLKLTDALNDLRQQFKDHGPDTDTLNVSAIESGEMGLTKVPHFAKAQVEVRLNDDASEQRTQKLIEQLCQEYGIEAKRQYHLPRTGTDLNNPLVSSFAQIIEEVVGVTAGAGYNSLGTSDARYFAAKGVPYAVFYPYGGGHHGADEWLDIQALDQTAEVVLRYLNRVVGTSS